MGAVVCRPVRAKLPRHASVRMRARVGVLEDVRGPAGDGPGSGHGDEQLGNGLHEAKRHEDALSVREAELSMLRRLGVDLEGKAFSSQQQGNLRVHMEKLGRHEEALNADAAKRILWSLLIVLRRGT